jgi:hypothetical protein
VHQSQRLPIQWTSLLALFVFVFLWSRSNPLSLQLATESPPVHQRHCTSSGTLFIVAFTPPQLRLHAPRTRLNISLLALARPLSTSLHPLTFDIYPPPPRSVLRVRTAQSLLPHTHTVYVYIPNSTNRSHSGRGRSDTPTDCTSASPHRTYVCASGVRAIDVRIPPQTLTWSSDLRRRSSLGFPVVKHDSSP